jgi:predicted nucleotidyltransferase
MRLYLDNLPDALKDRTAALTACLQAFAQVAPIHAVYLFGSFARGDARSDSDVDLCIVADGAERQLDMAQRLRRSIRHVRPKPALTLLPITPQRLSEKRARQDPFFATVLKEGVLVAARD